MIRTKHLSALLITLFLMIPLGILGGCADNYMIKKQKKIQRMTDTELLSYYHGISDRIKDIDNDFRNDQDLFNPKDQEPKNRFPAPHYPGSNAYNLYQIRKLVTQEIQKRNLALP